MLLRWSLTLAAALCLGWQLFPPPVPGVADNGDFGKLLGRYSLGSGQVFVYANTKFLQAPQYGYHSGFNSSELLLIAPALAINQAISQDGSFDLRIIGAVHASLLVLGVFLLIPVLDTPAIGAVAVLLFCDFVYAGYLNSFYMDAASLLFVLLSAVFYLRAIRWRRRADSAALVVCMLLAVTSKPHYAILGPWFALLFWAGRDVLCGGRRAIAGAATLLLMVTSWASYRFLAPAEYAAKNPFTIIFTQILPNRSNPGPALVQLGLDDSYRQWIGMQAYTPGAPVEDSAFSRQFLQKTSYWKIARFYLLNPADAWRAFITSLDEVGRFQSPLGNFDSGSGNPPAAQYQSFQLASGLKRRLFHYHGGRLFFSVMGLAVAVTALLVRDRRRLPAGAALGGSVLTAMTVATLLISALADVYDQARHQLVFYALFDMLLLALFWLMLRRASVVTRLRR